MSIAIACKAFGEMCFNLTLLIINAATDTHDEGENFSKIIDLMLIQTPMLAYCIMEFGTFAAFMRYVWLLQKAQRLIEK